MSSRENDKFLLKYKWSQEFKPLIGLEYDKMLSLENFSPVNMNNKIAYKITIVYNDTTSKDFVFSQEQKDQLLTFILDISSSGKQIITEFNKKYN